MLIPSLVSRLRRLLRWRLGAGMLALALVLPVQAGVVAVVLSDETAPYHETMEAIETALRPQHTVVRVQADRLNADAPAMQHANLQIAIGVKAADLLAAQSGGTPLLAVLVTEDWYRTRGGLKLSASGRNAGVVVLEQPFPRQLRLARLAFPKVSRLGAVVGRKNAGQLDELRTVTEDHGFSLIGGVVESEASLVTTLGRVLKEADLLLAVPDAEVLNRNTVQSVLMTTYRYRDPVLGYSKALSRAGALVSLYTTPAQIGRQAGEIALRVLDGGKLPTMQWPRYFSVSVNEHVARSLGIEVPDEGALMDGLLKAGND